MSAILHGIALEGLDSPAPHGVVALQVVECEFDSSHRRWKQPADFGQQDVAYLVARIVVFKVGAVGHVVLSQRFQIVYDFITAGTEQRAHDFSVARLYSGKSCDSRAAHKVQKESLDVVVAMVGHGNNGAAQGGALTLEPVVAQFAACHFGRHTMAFLVGFDIEIGASQLDVEVVAKFTHKRLVAVSLVAAQVEVAVGSDAVAAQRRKHSQQGDRVGASADSSQNLSVGDSRHVSVDIS